MLRSLLYHGLIFSLLSVFLLFILHHLPVNQLFIDPFSEAIKNHDVMDIAISKFRNHEQADLFDEKVYILNSEITNREEIAVTVDYLQRHGTKAIGIDLIFDSLYQNKADTILARALSNKNIVLGYTFNEKHIHDKINGLNNNSVIELKSDTLFTSNVEMGYVNLGSNDGFSVRAFEPFHYVEGKYVPSFAVKLASIANPEMLSKLNDRNNKIEWINFKRIQPGVANRIFPINSKAASHYAYSSITTFLSDTSAYAKDYFQDKIVLIGFNGENNKALSMKDRYFTPLNEVYHGRSLPDMHGVVVHANIISMLLNDEYIDEVSEKFLYLISFLIFLLNYYLFEKISNKRYFLMIAIVRSIQIIQFIFLFTLCIVLMAFFNIKVGFILMITAVILSYELYEFYEHKLKNRFFEKATMRDNYISRKIFRNNINEK